MANLAKLKADLPNFPDEVLSDWLLPYARTEGWPPVRSAEAIPEGRWRFLLRKQPLAFWSKVKWQKVERHLAFRDLHPQNQEIALLMVLGATKGHRNLYSDSIPDLKERFMRVVDHLKENGRLPGAPTLISETGGLSVLDGNHRIAAYLYSYGYFKLELDDSLLLKTQREQAFWVGEI